MDRRTTPSNGEVAAEELRGKVEARRFVTGDIFRITAPVADLHCSAHSRQLDRQLLNGDRFRVFATEGGLAFGQSDRGNYVGYVDEACLGSWQDPTHWVSAPSSFAFSEPDFKSPHPTLLSHSSRETVIAEVGRFSKLASGQFVPSIHLEPLSDPGSDPAAEAEKYLGCPYLWGGNTFVGIDCSGLVQAAFEVCGLPCPGDSDLQEQAFAKATGPYQRNDLLFWKGHVAIVVDSKTLLHANAHHMAVTFEPIAEAISRISKQGDGPVIAHKRPTL